MSDEVVARVAEILTGEQSRECWGPLGCGIATIQAGPALNLARLLDGAGLLAGDAGAHGEFDRLDREIRQLLRLIQGLEREILDAKAKAKADEALAKLRPRLTLAEDPTETETTPP